MRSLTLVAVVLALAACGERKNYCQGGGQSLATVMAQNAVKRQLRSPSTASFVSGSATHVRGCLYRATGMVDAQNGFGAMIRNSYQVDIEYRHSDRTWRAKKVTVN